MEETNGAQLEEKPKHPRWLWSILSLYILVTTLSLFLYFGILFLVLVRLFGTHSPEGLENLLWDCFYSLVTVDLILGLGLIFYNEKIKPFLIISIFVPVGFVLYFLVELSLAIQNLKF